jgi:hypothetical protein
MKTRAKEDSVAYSPEYYQANKAAYAAKSKVWRETNPIKASENRRRYYEANKKKELEYSTNYNRFHKLGMTKEEYDVLLEKQKGVCAICHQQCSRALAADHDHATGKIRGLLCNKCNRGLGYFRDSHALLIEAADYLLECS